MEPKFEEIMQKMREEIAVLLKYVAILENAETREDCTINSCEYLALYAASIEKMARDLNRENLEFWDIER
jgi:hypothetical protein